MENKNEKELKKLNNEDLEKTSGGYIYDSSNDCISEGRMPDRPYQVVDDETGKVLGHYSSKREAERMAKAKGQTVETGDKPGRHRPFLNPKNDFWWY